MLAARDIVNEARDLSPAFDPRRITPTMALRMLCRAERTLFRAVTEIKQEALASDEVIDVADIQAALDADPPTPVAIDAHIVAIACMAQETDTGKNIQVEIIPFSKRLNPGIFPSAYIINNQFYPIDLRQLGYETSGWEDYSSVTLTRVPIPPVLARFIDDDAAAINILAPDSAYDALVAAVALSMAQRVDAATPSLVQMASATMAQAINLIANGDHSGSWHVLDTR